MAPKRKRDEGEEQGSSSTPTHASRPSFGETASPTSTPSSHLKRPKFDPNSLRVVWQLADGSDSYSHRLAEHDTLNDAIYHMNKSLDISTPGDVRLAQVRDTGREVDLCDDFDYQALKDRALAGRSGGTIVVNVYPGHRASSVIPTQRALHATPRSSASGPAQDGPHWHTPPEGNTPDHSPAPRSFAVSPADPNPPVRSVSDSRKITQQQKKIAKRERKKAKQLASEDTQPILQGIQIPVVQTDHEKPPQESSRKARRKASQTLDSQSPSPLSASTSQAAKSLTKFEQYKPVKPSPLGQATRQQSSPTPSSAQPDTEDSSALGLSGTTPVEHNQSAVVGSTDAVIGPAPSLALPIDGPDHSAQALPTTEERPQSDPDADANAGRGQSPPTSRATTSPPLVASPFDLTTTPRAAVSHRQRSDRSVTPAALQAAVVGLTADAPSATSIPTTKALPLASSWNLVQLPKGTKAPPSRSSSELAGQRTPRKSTANPMEKTAVDGSSTEHGDEQPEPAQHNPLDRPVTVHDPAASTSAADPAASEVRPESTMPASLPPASTSTPAKTPKLRGKKKTVPVSPPPDAALPHSTISTDLTGNSAGTSLRDQIEASETAHPIEDAVESEVAETKQPAKKRGRPRKVPAVATGASTEAEVKTPAKRGPKKGAKAAANAAAKAAAESAQSETTEAAEAATAKPESKSVPAGSASTETSVVAPDADRAQPVLQNLALEAGSPVDYFSPTPSTELPSTLATADAAAVDLAPTETPASPASETSSREVDEHAEAFIPGLSPPPGMKEGGPIENAILAGRVACIICQKSPTHLEKDCPLVKAGMEALREALEARRTELKECRGRKGAPPKGKMQVILGTLRRSIDTITGWIERLEDLEERRNAMRSPLTATRPEVATDIARHRTPASEYEGQRHVEPRSPGSSPSDRDDEEKAAKRGKQQFGTSIPPTPDSGPHSAGVHMIDLLHQKALRMGRHHPSRAISSSGLSASDAIIETGSSGSDSDSDSIESVASSSEPSSSSSSASSTDSMSPLDENAGDFGHANAATEGERTHYGGDRVASLPNGFKDVSAASEDGDDEGGVSDVEMRSNLSHSTADPSSTSSSVSSSSSPSASSRSTRSLSPASPSPIGDPESSFLHFLKKPLSVKERRRARVSAASMPASQDLMDIDEIAVDDKEDSEEEKVPVSSGRLARRGSDSSIDVGVDDEMDAQSDIVPATPTQPPAVEPDHARPVGAPPEQTTDGLATGELPVPLHGRGNSAPRSGDTVARPPTSTTPAMRRSSTSPVVGGSDGDSALRAAAGDDAVPLGSQSPEKPARHIISQGLPSPVSSQDGQMPATQLIANMTATQPIPPKRRGRPPKLALVSSNHSQSPAAAQEAPSLVSESSQLSPDIPNSQSKASVSPRATRGRAANSRRSKIVGFDVADGEQEPTPTRLTRRSAAVANDAVQAVAAPPFKLDTSSPLTAVPSATMPADYVANGNVNGHHGGDDANSASPSDARDAVKDDSQVAEASDALPNGVMTQLTQRSLSPLHDESAQSRVLPSPGAGTRRSTRNQRSPSLFLSQGSQGLATQKYSTALSSSQSQTASLTNGRKVASPIPEDDELDAQNVEEATSPAPDADPVEESDDDGHAHSDSDGSGSSSAGDDDVPLLRPAIVARRSASADPSQVKIAVPSLGSLDTAMLRNPNSRRSLPATQPTPRSKAMVEESESESSSSDDEPTPVARKGRYATGKARPARKMRASGSVTGW